MDKESRTGLRVLARIGYAARGVIYVIVGSFAALAALGRGDETPDSRGALVELLNAPFGKILLGMVAAGLVGYALWRAVQALLDADDHGTDMRGLVIRSGLAVSAVTHAALAVAAVGLIFGWGTGGSGDSSREWTAKLMSQPWGAWLVGAVGLAIVGAGVAHGIKAWRGDFRKRFEIDGQEQRYIMPVSRFGLYARGAVFIIIGAFVVTAAVQNDPSEARGLSGTLQALQDQPYGWILLGIVAVGLVAFGAYSIIESVYRRIGPV
jgi:hypothetical protein